VIQHILVPFDQSIKAKKALEFTLEEFANTDITTLYVKYGYNGEDTDPETLSVKQQDAEETLVEATDIAAEYDRVIDTEIRTGRPADEIIKYATGSEIELIIMGSHGRSGLSRIMMGSVAESVARRSPLPVTIV